MLKQLKCNEKGDTIMKNILMQKYMTWDTTAMLTI